MEEMTGRSDMLVVNDTLKTHDPPPADRRVLYGLSCPSSVAITPTLSPHRVQTARRTE